MYAIGVLGGLEALALHHGIDGTLFVPIATLIAGLGGFAFAKAGPSDST